MYKHYHPNASKPLNFWSTTRHILWVINEVGPSRSSAFGRQLTAYKYTHLPHPHSTPDFAKLSPLEGEPGLTLASPYTICLCPLAFASVSRCFKGLITTQHRHRPVVYPATRLSKFYDSYRSLGHACGYNSTWRPEALKPWPIGAVSVMFSLVAV